MYAADFAVAEEHTGQELAAGAEVGQREHLRGGPDGSGLFGRVADAAERKDHVEGKAPGERRARPRLVGPLELGGEVRAVEDGPGTVDAVEVVCGG